MKRIVFLLLVLFCSVSSVDASTSKTFEDGDTIYIVTDYIEDGSKGFTLEKKGLNPFVTSFLFQGESYIINGVKELDDYIFVYGSAHISGKPTYYDSVIIVFDLEGNYYKKIIEDFNMLEETVNLFYLDGVFFSMITENYDQEGVFEFNGHHFIAYDQSFNEIQRVDITIEIHNVSQTENFLLLSYDYDDFYEVAFTSSLDIIRHNDLLDISPESRFENAVTLPFINQATLNGEVIEHGYVVDYPGNYELNYNDNRYVFFVDPVITGVEHNGVYSEGVLITYSAGNANLNGDSFVSGNQVDNPGNYQLIITGVNGYQKIISFTITSSINGLINQHEYQEPFEFYFNGEGYLNEQHTDSPVLISEEGEYSFKVLGEEDYIESYQFTLNEESKTGFVDFIQRYDIVILVAAIFTGIIILKKK